MTRASAVMAGLKVVVVECDENGNIDIADLRTKAGQYQESLAALMVTYPSTHGVFETSVRRICQIVHTHGGANGSKLGKRPIAARRPSRTH